MSITKLYRAEIHCPYNRSPEWFPNVDYDIEGLLTISFPNYDPLVRAFDWLAQEANVIEDSQPRWDGRNHCWYWLLNSEAEHKSFVDTFGTFEEQHNVILEAEAAEFQELWDARVSLWARRTEQEAAEPKRKLNPAHSLFVYMAFFAAALYWFERGFEALDLPASFLSILTATLDFTCVGVIALYAFFSLFGWKGGAK